MYFKATIAGLSLLLAVAAVFMINSVEGQEESTDVWQRTSNAAVMDEGSNEEPEIMTQAAYVPQAQEITPQEEFQALLQYARRRYAAAVPYGMNIQAGRHYPDDTAAFGEIIEALTQDSRYVPTLIEELQAAIDAFNHSMIDPDNRYRPFLSTIARGEDVPQKHHLRAVWIATVLNIDWPSVSARGTTPQHVDMQKEELVQRFDEMANFNVNAVIFQISPTADAFYNSDILPWSAWLTGETNFTGELLDSAGNAFDPLQFAIDLARERNMEMHAWFNPYRITHTIAGYTRGDGIILSSQGRPVESLDEIRTEMQSIADNPFNTMGQYIHLGENRYVLDPGVPAARQWIVERVLEVVNNYDIDAVHFDDYFYPSGWSDDDTFARFNPNGLSHADWRRENTEKLIREVNEAVKEVAPWVKFGISPGGVWISGDGSVGLDGGDASAAAGSLSTTSWSNYHSSFADTRRWVVENFIDYITPQIYWDWSLAAAPYGPIADWWSRLVRDYGPDGHLRNSAGEHTNAHLYIGLGLYRMVENPTPKWRNSPGYEYEGKRTFLRQEHYNLGNENIQGSMIFAHNHMRAGQNGHASMEHLRNNAWRYPALVPAMEHLGGRAPAPPVNAIVGNGIIVWRNSEMSSSELVRPGYFVIYRAKGDVDISNPANIYAIVPAVVGQNVYWHRVSAHEGYNFRVTAANRLHQESN